MKKHTLQGLKPLSLLLFLLILLNQFANAQCTPSTLCGPNIVPNPSFETTTSQCGTVRELYTDRSPVANWFGLACSSCTNKGSNPDYYNSNCAGANSTLACETSSGYGSVGMYTSLGGGGNARESVQAQLTTTLKAGHQYCFSMRVRSDFTGASDGIGAWFHSKGKLSIDSDNNGVQFLGAGTKINASPQVQNVSGNMIETTCKWITGTFCATGGESWVVISNFRTDANTNGTNTFGTYLVVDEISLRESNCLTITSISTTADSVCPGSCVTLKANPSGGNGTYSYLWSTGETSQSISACPTASPATYKCTVTSSLGCASASSVVDSVTIYHKKYIPTPTITTSNSSTICSGDTLTLTSSSAPNYKWSTGATTQSIKVTTAGAYSVTVTHPYSACNTTSATVNVVVNPLPTLNLSSLVNTSSSCDKNDGSVTGIVGGGKPPLTYSWSSNPVQTTPDLINVGPGTYTLTVTDSNGCKKTTAATIVFKPNPPVPTITASASTICTENNTILYVTSSDPTYTYTWKHDNIVISTNDTVFINDAKLSDGGIYYVTATKFGCEGAATNLTLTVNETPDTAVLKATANVICEGTKTVLYVNPPTDPLLTYTWETPDGSTITNDSVIIDKAKLTDAGTYILVGTKSSCPSHDAHISLTVNPAATSSKANVTKGTICEGDTVTISPANPIAGVAYQVYTQATGGNPIGTAPLEVYPAVTTKYYMEAVTSNGCSQLAERDTVTINVYTAPPVPPPTASNTTICEGKSTIIDVQNPDPAITYNVYDALTKGNLIGKTPLTITLTQTTTFYIEAVTSNGCKQVTGRKPITIHVNPTPQGPKILVENPTGNYICQGLTAILKSTISSGITWSTGETTSSITVKTAGVYTVYYTDANGCASLKDSVKITIEPTPKVDASSFIVDTVRCNATIGGIHGVVISNGTSPYTFKWFETSDPGKIISTDLILKGVPEGKYTLIVTDKNGCEDRLSNVLIPSKGGIVAHLNGNPNSGFEPLNVDLITTTSGVGKPIDFVWTVDGRPVATTDNKTNIFSVKDLPFGEHILQVAVRDSNGCKSVDYLKVFVYTKVEIPDVNIFTPNNDGHNDVLTFPTDGIQTMDVAIYDRWGLKIYEWSDPDKGWDGNMKNGKAASEGTYFYIIKYTDYYGNSGTKPGHIQLMRDR